jgi:hypothetical protein
MNLPDHQVRDFWAGLFGLVCGVLGCALLCVGACLALGKLYETLTVGGGW